MTSKNYYEILGVSRDADEVVIRAAYRALAQKYHPDKAHQDSVKENSKAMSDINMAYSILGDANKRRAYDQRLSDYSQQSSNVYNPPKQKEAKYRKSSGANTEHKPQTSNLGVNIFILAAWAACFYYIYLTIIKK